MNFVIEYVLVFFFFGPNVVGGCELEEST